MRKGGIEGLGMIRPESGAIRPADRSQNNGAFPLPVGTPPHGAEFRGDLIEGGQHEVGKLNAGNRFFANQRLSDRRTDNGGFAERGIEDLLGEVGAESTRQAEDIPLGVFDIFSGNCNGRVASKAGAEDLSHRFEHGEGIAFITLLAGRRGEGLG